MQVVDWLSRLIAFNTISANSNLQLIEMLQAWFKERGLAVRLSHDPKEPKANLFATIPDSKGNITGGIVLSGHTDTVPCAGQNWETDPFEATEEQGLIYGRGACDMKGFIAATLALVPEWQTQPLAKPIHFAFSYDEEIGCRGVQVLLDDLKRAGIKPEACIVGEPTMMQPVVAHKGIRGFNCKVKGLTAHSSLTNQGCNAIEYAAMLISYLRQVADQLRGDGEQDKHFDVPYSTISTNMVSGGIATNVIPSACEFNFEFRHLPNVKASEITNIITAYIRQELLPLMQSQYPEAAVDLTEMASAPSFEAISDAKITQVVAELLNDKKIHKVAYATEAGFFTGANIPTIVCGPGSIEQAHKANEFVAISQLEECQVFLRKLIAAF